MTRSASPTPAPWKASTFASSRASTGWSTDQSTQPRRSIRGPSSARRGRWWSGNDDGDLSLETYKFVVTSADHLLQFVAWQRLDMVVDRNVIVEIKASERLPPYAQRQIFNYLRATRYGVGLLLHFGPRPEVHRFVDHPKGVAPGMGGTGLKQDESG